MNLTAQMIGFFILIAFVLVGLWKKFSGGGDGVVPSSVPASVSRWKNLAQKYGEYFNIPWQIVLAQIWKESDGDPNAVGSAGEIGLMQLKQIAVNDLAQNKYDVPAYWENDPEANIIAGVSYLDLQRKRTGSLADALQAYNQGFEGAKQNPTLAKRYSSDVLRKAHNLGYNV